MYVIQNINNTIAVDTLVTNGGLWLENNIGINTIINTILPTENIKS